MALSKSVDLVIEVQETWRESAADTTAIVIAAKEEREPQAARCDGMWLVRRSQQFSVETNDAAGPNRAKSGSVETRLLEARREESTASTSASASDGSPSTRRLRVPAISGDTNSIPVYTRFRQLMSLARGNEHSGEPAQTKRGSLSSCRRLWRSIKGMAVTKPCTHDRREAQSPTDALASVVPCDSLTAAAADNDNDAAEVGDAQAASMVGSSACTRKSSKPRVAWSELLS
eukprot:TRINITY_DN19637_c0_g2_i1.p1 TRINITY_DN19637_c0_g2~~TRINITY_DN19637_c0_g2_i1.p1  ORF type:complete len:256 (+),score=23.56 TRINITY_DN19637_c0_g2_i1:77-769(+)